MNDDGNLQDRFRKLAQMVPQKASPELETELRLAFRDQFAKGRRLSKSAATIAAAIIIAAGVYLLWLRTRDSGQQTAAVVTMREMPGFVALPYAQSDVPLEQPIIVRVQIPVSDLRGAGVPFTSVGAREKVNADLLVGQDGVARAVRVIQQ